MYRQMYSFVFNLATPLVLGRLVYRGRKAPAYRQRVGERFALGATFEQSQQKKQGRLIWIHAVSVGEVIAAAPLVNHILNHYQDDTVLVTSTTPTGSDQVLSRWRDRVIHLYLPYDYAWTMKRFIRAFCPALLIVIETELWPNLIHFTAQAGCPIFITNARLSAGSAKGYSRFYPLVKGMLEGITRVAVQAKSDGERFIQLGLNPKKLEITGSIKFDIKMDELAVQQGVAVRNQLDRPTWIAASTHSGEDEIILEAFAHLRKQQENALLVIVPRHPERFGEVTDMANQAGWCVHTRSQNQAPNQETDVFVGDSMGELTYFYAMCDVAFVGGSLTAVGGHNVLEPVAIGLPVLVGPHMFNFQFVADALQAMQGIQFITSAMTLAKNVERLLLDSEAAKTQAKNATEFLIQNRGAFSKQAATIDALLKR